MRLGLKILQLNGNGTIDREFLDRLKVGFKFDDTTPRGEIAMNFPVAIANMNVNGLAFEFLQISGWSV